MQTIEVSSAFNEVLLRAYFNGRMKVSKTLDLGSNPSARAKLKTGNMNKISTYFRESYKELMEKVTWPTWAQLQQSTMIVLAATLVITALVWVMDFATGNVLKQVYKFFF
jgi:preprotein translocase subunit SecE